jgi:hypothetical protein
MTHRLLQAAAESEMNTWDATEKKWKEENKKRRNAGKEPQSNPTWRIGPC